MHNWHKLFTETRGTTAHVDPENYNSRTYRALDASPNALGASILTVWLLFGVGVPLVGGLVFAARYLYTSYGPIAAWGAGLVLLWIPAAVALRAYVRADRIAKVTNEINKHLGETK